jgi:hypothetical protein
VTNFVNRLRRRFRKEHVGTRGRVVQNVSRQLVFEPLESRLLLSADSPWGVVHTGEPAAKETAEPPAIVAALNDVSPALTLAAQREEQQASTPLKSLAVEQMPARHEIVFVDTNVTGYEQLVKDFLSANTNDRWIEVRILDAERDGIEQISEVLAGYSELDAVHFVSHGTDGAVWLGATWLDINSLQAAAHSIAGWSAALSENADLLFYGCNVASSEKGRVLLWELSELTRADVAASVDPTGSTALGGDFDLEFAAGTIDAGVAGNFGIQQSWSGLLDTASLQASQDTYIRLRSPDDTSNFGASMQLVVDRESTDLQRALLQFDLSGIPANATINSATLQMQATQIGGTLNISVYELLQAWSEGTANGTPDAANWNERTTGTNWTTAGGTFNTTAIANLNTNSTGLHTWDITSLVQAWVDGSSVNNGLMVASPDGGGNRTVTYDSSEGTTKPILVIDYSVSNAAPTASNMSTAETYTLNTPLNLVDIVISDVDSANVTARLTLSDPGAGSLNTGTSGAVTSTYNAVSGVWTASGAIADVNALLADLTYTPTLLYLLPFTIATSVDDGVSPAITGSKSMTVSLVNLPPTATNLSAPETYTEDTPFNLTDIVVTDLDSPNVTATLTLSDTAAGSLSTATSGSVTSTYNAVTGVWTASGAKADVNTLLAGVTFTPALNYNSNFTIATSVDDGVAPAITGVKNITGTAVNDAPTATNLSAAETYTEDTPFNLTDIVVSDVDSANVTVTLTLSDPGAGSLSTATASSGFSGSVTSTYNASTGVWTASGAVGNVNTLLNDVTFTPSANYNSNFTIATSVSDGIAPAITGVKNMTGTAVNDAPTATNLSAAETYTEDTPLSLTDIVVSDVDSTNVTVTLTLSDSAAGALSTATSGSVTSTYNAVTGVWTASGTIADVNTLLAGVTFTPALNYNSNFTIATSVDDGVSPAITGVKNMAGTAVNDAPTATNLNAAESYTEDTSLNLTDIVVSDVDSANVTVTLTLSDSAAGGLSTGTSGSVSSTYNAATGVWTASGAKADVNTLLAGVTFTPSLNYNSNFTIATSVDDGVATAITGIKNMTGTAQNDAPTLTNNTLTITEGSSVLLSTANLSATDVDNAAGSLTFTVSGVSGGQFELVSSPGVAITSFTQVQVSGGEVRFVHDGGEAAPSYDVTVSDGVLSDGPAAATISFTNQNDAPTATNLSAAETYTEDTPLNLTNIVITDVDSANVTATLTLSDSSAGSLSTATSGSVTSTYNAATGVWTASGAKADVNTLLSGVTFTPSLNYNSNFTIATCVDDGVAPAITGVKNITGTAVNDAPTATNLSAAESYTEDIPLNLTDIVVSDVDSANVTATLTLSDSVAGALSTATSGSVTSTYNAATGVWTATGAIVDVNTLLAGVTFTPTLNYNSNFTIATIVDDGVAPAITGVKNITGVAVNDTPAATNLSAAETYTEDTPLNLTDIVVSDVDSANVTVALTLSDTAAGSLNTATSGSVTSTYDSGTGVWTASGAVVDVNSLLAGLTFTPALNYNGNFTIATSVEDGVAPAITGVKNMTGTAVNDAPTATNLSTAETYTEDTPLNLTDIASTDVDSANVTATLTLSDSSAGSLSTATSGSVTSTYNAATGVWTATGAIVDVNTLLAGVTFTPSLNYNSNFTIATSVNDGVAPAITGVKNMTGTAVNDAPTATNLSAAESYTEDTPLNLTDIVVSDVDSANVTATLTLSDSAAGALSTATSGSVTSTYNAATGVWTASGAKADVNTLLAGVTFTPALNYNSNFTIATSVDDGVAAPITGVKSVTGIAVNDAPLATNLNAAETYTEDTPLNLTNIVISDVDSANVTATLTLSDSGAGSLSTATSGSVISTYNAATGVWAASGAIADVNTLLASVTFTPALNYNSNFTIATSVDDGVAPAIAGVKNMTSMAQNDGPVLANNTLTITEGGSVVLSATNLSATDVDNAAGSLTFTVSAVSGGKFELVSSPGVAVTSFTQGQVSGGEVRFVHDGEEAAPSYDVTVSDGVLSDGPATATISFTNQNDAPILTNNQLTIARGAAVVLSSVNLAATDVDNAAASLIFTVSGVSGGQFELLSGPRIAITSFTQAQVTGGQVRFVHNGGQIAPSYDVAVSDGALSDGPVTATINFTNPNDIVEPIDPPPVPGISGPTPPVEGPILGGGGQLPVDNPNPTSGPTLTGAGGGSGSSSSPSTEPDVFASEFQVAVSTADILEAGNTNNPSSRMVYKPVNETQNGMSGRNEVPSVTLDAAMEEMTASTIAGGDLGSVVNNREFIQGLNKLRDEAREDTQLDKVIVGSTLTVTSGLSIGYLIWLLRGDVLLSSILASLPAWRLVDPLPVLTYFTKRSKDDEEEDESIESVIKKGAGVAESNELPRQHRGSRSVKWRMIVQATESMSEGS